MKRSINICTIYTLVLLLYSLQSMIGISETPFSFLLLGISIFLSVYFFIKCNLDGHLPLFLVGLNFIIILFSIYGVALVVSGESLYVTEGDHRLVNNYDYLKRLYLSLLPFYSYYFFSKKGYLTIRGIKWWTLVFFLCALAQFAFQRQLIDANSSGSNVNYTNNSGYMVLMCLPLLCVFINNRVLQLFGLILGLLAIALSYKRGAILSAIIVGVYFIFSINRNEKNKKKKFFVFIVTVSSIVFLYLFLVKTLGADDYFQYRLQMTLEGDASGRNEIFPILINAFRYDASFLQVLFGRGAWGTLKVSPNFAHNDWLEILTNQGLLGLFAYSFFWFAFFKTIRNRSYSKVEKDILIMVFVIVFMRSFFSMAYNDLPIYITSITGFALAKGLQKVN